MDEVAAITRRSNPAHSRTLQNFRPVGWARRTPCGQRGSRPPATGCCLPTPTSCSSRTRCAARLAYAEAEHADHVVLFPRMIMKHPGERMMIAFFQALFVFGHRPWKVADPGAQDHMGVGAFNMVRRSVYEAVGTYQALRMEVLDDMKLGKVVKNAGLRAAQRVRRGLDLPALGARHIRNRRQSHQEFLRPAVVSVVANRCLDLSPWHFSTSDHFSAWGWPTDGRGCPYAIALASLFGIYLGNVEPFGCQAVLFPAASGQHGRGDVYCCAVNDLNDVARGNCLARDEVFAR